MSSKNWSVLWCREARVGPVSDGADPVIASLALLGMILLSSCGYHLVGTSSALPPNIRSIYIPVFTNSTAQPELEQRLSDTVNREFINRGQLKLAPEAAKADAILAGEITNFGMIPLTLDQQGRATEYQIGITLKVALRSVDGKTTYWENPSFVYQERYPIDLAAPDYFDRLNVAVDEISVKFAQTLVTTILEGF